MKHIRLESGHHIIELTRRNLEGLLAKLDDPHSARTLIAPEGTLSVTAVENEEHYADRVAGVMYTNGEYA